MIGPRWEDLNNDPRLAQLKRLSDEVAKLASEAEIDFGSYPTLDDLNWLDRVFQRTSSMFTIIVVGQVSSGKSSFINSLLGRKLLLPSDSPTDGVVSVLLAAKPGEPEYAEKVLATGEIERFTSMDEAMKFLRQQNTLAEQQLLCKEVRLYLQDPWLRQLRIVNTPGLGDRLQAFETAALQYLHEDESDLVVWTFFPEVAANSDEVGIFSKVLSRRSEAVIGVVSRCLEGREDYHEYYPKSDPSLVGERGVERWMRAHLGQFLKEVILYDSHVARRLVQRMREKPELQSDANFVAELERCGHAHFQRTLAEILGMDGERIQDARVASVLTRCHGHAVSVASAADAAEKAFLRLAEVEAEKIAAWQKIERDLIGPARSRFREDLRALAQERSKELVVLMGNGAADAIEHNFGLLGTLGRSLVSWTGICDSASDALSEKISNAVGDSIDRARFYFRLNDALQDLITEHLLRLQMDLEQARQLTSDRGNGIEVPVDTGRPIGAAGAVLGDAISGALKSVVAALLKSLAKTLEERAAAAVAKEAAEQAARQTAAKAATKAVEQGAGAVTSKIAGIITLVLVPFDIAKLVKDFHKGRQNLVNTVRTRYQADRPSYDLRIFDGLWPLADDAFVTVLKEARMGLEERNNSRTIYLESAQTLASARQALGDLAERLADRG